MIKALLTNEFESIVDAQNIRSTSEMALPRSWTIPPDIEVSPGSAAEIAAVTVAAERDGISIIPIGGAQQLGAGYPPAADRPCILLSTHRMNRVLDHQPDDLTITCEAGVTLAEAEQVLRQHNQTLALDGPVPAVSTLGGLVASATAGIRRVAYGTPRDSLIGMKAVMTGGIEIKGGGKVVKNVAGYDVCKLFTGSWGSLGVLTEVTFKVRPLPETRRRLAWRMPDAAAAATLGFKLHLARLNPTMVLAAANLDLFGHPALIIGIEGSAQRVEWQAEEFARSVAAEGITESPINLTDEQVAGIVDWPATIATRSQAAARIACLPTELAYLVSLLSAIPSSRILADCTVGTLHCILKSASCDSITAVRSAVPRHANCVWTQLDIEGDCIPSIPRWGETREDRLLQAGVKSTLDRLDTFSPGRFPGSGR